MDEALEGIKMALETKLFTERQMVTGQNSGFRFFSLNKTSIVSFLQQFASLIGEELTDEDITVIRSALSKVSLSGIYRVEDIYGLIDNLLIRFKISETGPVKNLELNYRYKVSDLNKDNTIAVPTEFEEWSGIRGTEIDTETSF